MGSKSDYLEKRLLDLVLGGQALSPAATVYLALSTALSTDAATGANLSEVTGGGYARVTIANNSTNWPAATGASPATKSNGIELAFPVATGDWGTVRAFYLLDAATAGNVLYHGDLVTAKAVSSGDSLTFGAGALVITED